MKIIHKNFQTIIIGAGGAGLMAALSCVKNGVKDVAVISKVFPTTSHTVAAKGGINAALGNISKDDWEWHAFDTIKGSDYLADHDAVEFMCKSAPQAIVELEKMGVVFSRNNEGKIDQRIYGGQKTDFGKGELAHRACFSKDSTGHTILNTLYQQCLKNGVKFFSEFFVIDLLISGQSGVILSEAKNLVQNPEILRFAQDDIVKKQSEKNYQYCFDAIAIDLSTGEVNIFKSKNTILATGGYSQIYQHTTSSDICTGDGGALVLKNNLQLQDMEFVQFHPTSLYGTGLLISEAARGEGGYLVNGLGQKFMQKYAPNYGDLASRDIIARAIATEVHQGRGGGENKDQVYLVLSHLDEKTIKEKIPTVLEIATSFGKVNPFVEPIPIAPSAHYTMGGIPTNLNCQVLFNDEIVEGLMAIGEAASASVHGANRLGCNSLLDIIVFGNLAGKISGEISRDSRQSIVGSRELNEVVIPAKAGIQCNNSKQLDDDVVKNKISRITEILNQKGSESSLKIKSELKETVEKFIGVFRNQKLLEQGLLRLFELKEKLKSVEIKNKNLVWNDELVEFFETENLLLQAIATAYSALQRTESRGAHFREDFQSRDDKNWRKHSLVAFDLTNNNFDFKTKPVRIAPIGDSQTVIEPEERQY